MSGIMRFKTISPGVGASAFIPEGKESEGRGEYHLIVQSDPAAGEFGEQLHRLHGDYLAGIEELGLSENSLIFTRFYLSDAANQESELARSAAMRFAEHGAVSTIEQSPLGSNGKIALFAYHIQGGTRPLRKTRLDEAGVPGAFQAAGRSYDLVWHAGLTGDGDGSNAQTENIFSTLAAGLERRGMAILRHTVRTWIYIRDIDNQYPGMVKARVQAFEREGLTARTRYIASTGIEGRTAKSGKMVSMDALSIKGLEPRQIVRLEAPENLCPTSNYGVTFERGTKIEFGDRSHLFISGTASIDQDGKILHPGNARRQADRALENISALLLPHRAALKDMAYLFVYVRDPKDSEAVLARIRTALPAELPVLILKGAVCRQGWLVEIEGVAMVSNKSSYPCFP